MTPKDKPSPSSKEDRFLILVKNSQGFDKSEQPLSQLSDYIQNQRLEPQLNEYRRVLKTDKAAAQPLIYHFPRVFWSSGVNGRSQLTGYIAVEIIGSMEQLLIVHQQLKDNARTIVIMANHAGNGIVWVVWTGATNTTDFGQHVENCIAEVMQLSPDVAVEQPGISKYYHLVPDPLAYINPVLLNLADEQSVGDARKVDEEPLLQQQEHSPDEPALADDRPQKASSPSPHSPDDALPSERDSTQDKISNLRRGIPIAEEMNRPYDQIRTDTLATKDSQLITGMFRVRSAQNVLIQAALLPDPVQLYPPLIVESELIICFADTGIGKTVYAVQIAISIAATHRVLYVDLELSDKQFEKRYRNEKGEHYQFPANFFRADFTPRFCAPKGITYEQYFIQSLEQAIESTGAEVVVIDNMTKLSAGDTDTAKATIPVMENLSRIKFDSGITFLILEHNKKVDSSRPIQLNDLQGSKMKANFADSIFSIGRSQTDKRLRYVKQLKVRGDELVYDTENVATYEITNEGGFLHFESIGWGSEFDYLRSGEGEREDAGAQKYNQIQELRRQNVVGKELAEKMGMTKGAISKIEKKHGPKPPA